MIIFNLKVVRLAWVFRFFLVMLGMNSANVNADGFDTFNVVARSSYSHDSNLFKLPSDRPAPNGGERSDNILINSLGFTLQKKYSLQEFRANFDHVDTNYDNAKFLDFKANNYKAAWLWAITPALTGVLSADRVVSLVPFTDARSGSIGSVNISTQNIRVSENQIFSVDYSPSGKWHLLGGYTKLNVENSQPFLPETSFKLNSIEGGVKYESPSKSYISLITRTSDGQNQDTNTNPIVAVGSGFEEKQQELSAFWLITGKSRILANVGHIRRKDDTFQIRDFSGNFGGINYVWDVTGKTNISIGLSRRLSSFQTQVDSYGVYDVFNVTPTWNVTSKISINANAQIGRRVYKGDGPVASSFERQDDSVLYGVGIDWKPRSTIRLGVNLRRDERNSNDNNFDYSANVASVSGQLTF